VSLAVETIAAGGDGVGRTGGLVVFVPRTAPGDVVTAAISGRRHFARGVVREVVRPSAERIEPPCQHYVRDRCGGCQLQHLAYTAQLDAKRQIVADALTRIARRDTPVAPVVRSDSEWRYRSKLTLAMRRRGPGWIAGLHQYDDPAHVFPLADCPITDRPVVAVWREILAAGSHLPDVSALRGSVRWTDDGPVFVLEGARRWDRHAEFFAAVPALAALYWHPDDRPRRTLADRRSHASPGASFAQVNAGVAFALRAHVLGAVRARAPERVVDGYAGTGDLAATLAADGVAVTAIELDEDASAFGARRLAAPSRMIHARVEDALERALESAPPVDVVALNPPRGGLHERVPETLAARAPRARIVYVSCDPATLARDLRRLPGYALTSATPFDMFPQTAHIETVCVLDPETT